MQAPGLHTAAAVTRLSFTVDWQSRLVGYGSFPMVGLCNACQHQSPDYSSVLIPANVLCFEGTCVCHCGALPVLVGL